MKLEYLHDLTNGGQYINVVSENLIRLFHFELEEIVELQKQIQNIVITQEKPLLLHTLPFITSINCELILQINAANNGIQRINEHQFTCNLDEKGYLHLIELLTPFSNEKNIGGYQWLDPWADSGDIDFLLSWGGGW